MGEASEEYLWVAREAEREGDTLNISLQDFFFFFNLHSSWCVMCSGAISLSSKNKSLLKTFWGFFFGFIL